MSGFHGAFATDVACQQGMLTLPDTWFRPPLWDLLVLQLLRQIARTCHAYTRLLGTFSILLNYTICVDFISARRPSRVYWLFNPEIKI